MQKKPQLHLNVGCGFFMPKTLDNMVYMPYIISNKNGRIPGKSRFIIEFYEDRNGNKPIEEFLLGLDIKMRAKLVGLLQILQEKGNLLREPYSKHLEDGIFEIRGKSGNNITRVLYFFYYDGKIILTNGFIKKTQNPPPKKKFNSPKNAGQII